MPFHRKGLVIVLDGIGDLPSPHLDGATPLEAARTPALDTLAKQGLCGMVDPLAVGVPVDTHTGTSLLMGLVPVDAARLSRGPVEALGIGVPLAPGDVAVRANFATLEPNGRGLRVRDRRAGRISEGTERLCEAVGEIDLGDGIHGSLYPGTQHRAVVRLRGVGLSGAISDTDPGGRVKPAWVQQCEPWVADDSAQTRTAAALNKMVAEVHGLLRDHPLNRERIGHGLLPATGILTRGAGKFQHSRNLLNHVGLSAAVVAGECTVLGLGKLFGFEVISKPGFTALSDTDLEGKCTAARVALEAHDLVFLHIKATDICAHDRDPVGKRDVLQRIDAALRDLLVRDDLIVAVSGDHSTDSNAGVHSGEPVPSILRVPGGRRDRVEHYGECWCLSGGLGRITASGLITSTLDAMGWMYNYQPAESAYVGFP